MRGGVVLRGVSVGTWRSLVLLVCVFWYAAGFLGGGVFGGLTALTFFVERACRFAAPEGLPEILRRLTSASDAIICGIPGTEITFAVTNFRLSVWFAASFAVCALLGTALMHSQWKKWT